MTVDIALTAGVKTVAWAFDEGLPQKALSLVLPRSHVLVVGTTGSGKSMFLRSLEQPLAPPIPRRERTEMTQRQRVPLSKKRRVLFYDTPGHQMHEARRRETARNLSTKRRLGICNVVSHGYSEPRVATADALTKAGQPRAEWLKQNRQSEIDAVAEWAPILGERARYVITLVTKADLWWSDETAVMAHYESGDYADALRAAGVPDGRHIVLEYCSVLTRYFDDFKPQNEFDQRDQIGLRNNFTKQMKMLVER